MTRTKNKLYPEENLFPRVPGILTLIQTHLILIVSSKWLAQNRHILQPLQDQKIVEDHVTEVHEAEVYDVVFVVVKIGVELKTLLIMMKAITMPNPEQLSMTGTVISIQLKCLYINQDIKI